MGCDVAIHAELEEAGEFGDDKAAFAVESQLAAGLITSRIIKDVTVGVVDQNGDITRICTIDRRIAPPNST